MIFFGKIRILSFFNYTYENALRRRFNPFSLKQLKEYQKKSQKKNTKKLSKKIKREEKPIGRLSDGQKRKIK